MIAPRTIALFGGTFDPVHLGHLHLANLAQHALKLDQVRFLPCKISPHKSGTHPASSDDRCEMLRLATADLPWAVVDDRELHQAGPSYSYQTAAAIAQCLPQARLFWLMGCDQWDALPLWKNPLQLAAQVEFIVLAREQIPQPRPGYRLHLIHGDHPASATAIRHSLSCGVLPPPWLAPTVAQWIRQKGLYSR